MPTKSYFWLLPIIIVSLMTACSKSPKDSTAPNQQQISEQNPQADYELIRRQLQASEQDFQKTTDDVARLEICDDMIKTLNGFIESHDGGRERERAESASQYWQSKKESVQAAIKQMPSRSKQPQSKTRPAGAPASARNSRAAADYKLIQRQLQASERNLQKTTGDVARLEICDDMIKALNGFIEKHDGGTARKRAESDLQYWQSKKESIQAAIINRMERNEAAAIASLQGIAFAQIIYSGTNGRNYGTLAKLVNEKYLEPDKFNGYIYTDDVPSPPRSYKIIAVPFAPNITGRYAYSISEDMVVRYVAGPPGTKPGDYVKNTLPVDSTDGREAGAVSALSRYAIAQMDYSISHRGEFGTLEELLAVRLLDERYLSPEGFNGYSYTENKTKIPHSFELVADPTASEPAGRYVYSIAEDYVVRYVNGPSGTKSGDYVRNTLPADSAEARETAAVSALRRYAAAQFDYSISHKQEFGTLEDLLAGKFLDERYLSPEGFNGYSYTENKTKLPYSFELVAGPIASKPAGRYVYSIGSDQVIRYVEGPPGTKPGDYVGRAD